MATLAVGCLRGSDFDYRINRTGAFVDDPVVDCLLAFDRGGYAGDDRCRADKPLLVQAASVAAARNVGSAAACTVGQS